jgi:hypothetical protein
MNSVRGPLSFRTLIFLHTDPEGIRERERDTHTKTVEGRKGQGHKSHTTAVVGAMNQDWE